MRFARNLSAVGDPRPGAALPPHRGRSTTASSWAWASRCSTSTRCSRPASACPTLGITHRRTTISTVGWIPGIERLAESDMPVRLALSLHAAEEALRSQLMPVNDRYPLAEVLEACRALLRAPAPARVRRVRDARRRQRPLRAGARARARAAAPRERSPFKVNLIPFNPTGSAFRGLRPRGDRRVPRRARVARRARHGAPHARARHRRGLRAARRRSAGLPQPRARPASPPARASPARSRRSRSSACSCGLGSQRATSGS